MEKEIGKITHWYDKISVAVIKLTNVLKRGDRIKIKKGAEEIEELVNSLQIDRTDVEKGKKGDEVAVKLSKKAKEGSIVYKVE
jgi:putative protease